MSTLITALCAIRSPIDPKVALVLQKPQPGSNAWEQVVFNDHCYERTGDPAKTEVRTRAMAHVFGQAAALLAKEDPTGNLSIRTFYRNGAGVDKPRLHISIRPTATTNAPTMDPNAELAKLTQELSSLDFDFATVPANIVANTAAYVGFLKGKLAKLATERVVSETNASATPDEAPPL